MDATGKMHDNEVESNRCPAMKFGFFLVGIMGLSLSTARMWAEEFDWTVHLHKFGPLHIGMSIAEVRNKLDDPKAYLEYGGPDYREPDDSECAYLQSNRIPEASGLMFQRGRLVRFDVYAPGVQTAEGAGVGDGQEDIRKLYPGRIVVRPHPYIPEGGNYLAYMPDDPKDRPYGMVFETDQGRVTSFRSGTRSAIALIEGCS